MPNARTAKRPICPYCAASEVHVKAFNHKMRLDLKALAVRLSGLLRHVRSERKVFELQCQALDNSKRRWLQDG